MDSFFEATGITDIPNFLSLQQDPHHYETESKENGYWELKSSGGDGMDVMIAHSPTFVERIFPDFSIHFRVYEDK